MAAIINYNAVDIHPEACVALLDAAAAALAVLPGDAVLPTEPPPPQAQVLSDGALRVWIEHPARRRRTLAAIVVPAGYWRWVQ